MPLMSVSPHSIWKGIQKDTDRRFVRRSSSPEKKPDRSGRRADLRHDPWWNWYKVPGTTVVEKSAERLIFFYFLPGGAGGNPPRMKGILFFFQRGVGGNPLGKKRSACLVRLGARDSSYLVSYNFPSFMVLFLKRSRFRLLR